MTDTYMADRLRPDRDSLHILPLSDLPIQTPGLAHARLIKNVRLDSVVEVFSGAATGSGQFGIEDLPKEFGWNTADPPDDFIMIRRLGLLPSYDVYSLRISLRKQGIEVNDVDALRLSPKMSDHLTEYMKNFTRPLIAQIYGDNDLEIQDFGDVIKLFRDPDISKALEKIKVMASKLEIKPEEIPLFMEDYGDIFLSLSYYRRCLDDINPIISEFMDVLTDLRQNFQMKHEQGLMQTCDMMESVISKCMTQINERFENFERGTKHMWDNISAERFRKVERTISSHHTNIGGVLCALSVKMDAWHRLFPNPAMGGPGKKAEFIMSEMRQGMAKIKEIQEDAPMLAILEGA